MASNKMLWYHKLTLSLTRQRNGRREVLTITGFFIEKTNIWVKRTIHISLGDAKLDLSLKSPNAQLQCQARAKESGPRKCCSEEPSRNRRSILTAEPCKSSLKNWGKRSFYKFKSCSPHFRGYRAACIKLYFYRAWIISHSKETGIVLLSISATSNAKNTKSS